MRARHSATTTAAEGTGSTAEDPAAVLLCYSQLAAELEETTSPTRRLVLQQHLNALDAWLDNAGQKQLGARPETRGAAGE